MIKVVAMLAVVGWASAAPLTQEELAQYVARQQTAGLPRRQPYVLQQAAPQPRQIKYQIQPQQHAQYQAQPQPQYQEEPQYYQPQPQQYVAKKPASRPISYKAPGQPQEEEDYDPNPQYQFAFDIKDDEFTNYQNRKEQREGNKISGSYSVVDADGFIRTVKYTADPLEGFKADVVREPTDIKVKFPVPAQQQQYSTGPQQYSYQPQPALRKQAAQQYLQASSPVESKPHYAPRPEQTQAYQGKQLAYKAPSAYSAPKASALGYQQQPTASPILYQAYQQ